MPNISYSSFGNTTLTEFVAFWNAAFASWPNFHPMTEAVFHQRVLDKTTGIEKFDHHGLILARHDGKIVGFAHAGINPEEYCRVFHPGWEGGTQGYLGAIFVLPAERGKGIGKGLWNHAMDRLSGTRETVIDGQCMNPFWGNSEGPFTPFFGTTEGISVPWDDAKTKEFLGHRGFKPRYKAVSLEYSLGAWEHSAFAAAIAEAEGNGFAVSFRRNFCPVIGQSAEANMPYPPGLTYGTAYAVAGGAVAGTIITYPMKEISPFKHGVYELSVTETARGKGIGRALVLKALEKVHKSGGNLCETLTLPELSAPAHGLYLAVGFKPKTEWAIY